MAKCSITLIKVVCSSLVSLDYVDGNPVISVVEDLSIAHDQTQTHAIISVRRFPPCCVYGVPDKHGSS